MVDLIKSQKDTFLSLLFPPSCCTLAGTDDGKALDRYGLNGAGHICNQSEQENGTHFNVFAKKCILCYQIISFYQTISCAKCWDLMTDHPMMPK